MPPPRSSSTDRAGLFVLGASPLPASGADPAAPRRITMNLRDVPVGDVFEMLARNEKVNVLVGKGVTGSVSVNLHNVNTEEAVRTVAEAARYVAELRGDTFLVVERKDAGLDGLSGNTRLRTFKVQYSDAKTVAVILTKHISCYGKITPLPERNLIVVEDQPAFVARIEELHEQVDLPPRQILIEAKILEIRLDNNESFGVDWSKVMGGGNRSFTLGTKGLANKTEDGQSIFIGGLIRNTNNDKRAGIPLLGDIPVIGNAFSRWIEPAAPVMPGTARLSDTTRAPLR